MNPDLLIVGAGPAGVSAAIEARSHDLSVLLLDENPAPGGRIWQALETRDAKDADDAEGLRTIRAFHRCGADAHFRAAVWSIEPNNTVFWSEAGNAHRTTPTCILLCTGTTERPMPITGWTLPGVMTVGAAQIAWKTGGLVPQGATWIAGQGPLLMLYATQMLRAGGRIAGILDIAAPAARWRALPHLPRALRAMRELRKGVAWRREIARAGIPWLHASDLRAHGNDTLQSISFRANGRERTEPADLLLLHDGVVPSLQMTRALGCEHVWDPAQRCWKPRVDAWGNTSLPNILVAGDGAGIGGAKAAALSGRIAALDIAARLGRTSSNARDTAAAPLHAEHARQLALRPLLDTLFASRAPRLDDTTIVCRCEEVTAAQIRAAARLGCPGLNQLKAYTRCGMGPCQGRMCGPTAAAVLADARGVAESSIEPYRTRFPAKPLTVGELAAMAEAAT